MLEYSRICDRLSEIETARKLSLRDAINKFMIFEMNSLKNIEYNIPRYMRSLEKMDEKLLIHSRTGSEPDEQVFQLAKMSPSNYLGYIQEDEQFEAPFSHRKLLELKRKTPKTLTMPLYHEAMHNLNLLLCEA